MIGIRKKIRVNNGIKAKEVRVIDPDGKQLGILSLQEALEVALQYDMDLVEVSPKSIPPVCRIMDYGKFKYQESKKAQEAKKKQAIIQVKEIKLRPRTDEHDLMVKIKKIEEFLTKGYKTKVTVIFRGREIVHTEIGKMLINKIIEKVKDIGQLDQGIKLEGRNMVVVFSPKLNLLKGGTGAKN